MYIWELNVVDVRAHGKFNDTYVYILSGIDVFSKFLYLFSLRSKIGTAVASAFQSIINDPDGVQSGYEQIRAKNF